MYLHYIILLHVSDYAFEWHSLNWSVCVGGPADVT